MVNGEIRDMNIRKVFPVEGFRYKISVYSVYEPLIKLCFAQESICIALLHRFKTYSVVDHIHFDCNIQ